MQSDVVGEGDDHIALRDDAGHSASPTDVCLEVGFEHVESVVDLLGVLQGDCVEGVDRLSKLESGSVGH